MNDEERDALAARVARIEAICKIRGDALGAVKMWNDSKAPASIKAEQWPMILGQGNGGEAMTVKQIVAEWLKANGYDGLSRCDGHDGCGCGLDDFAPCGEGPYPDCAAAYYHSRPKMMLPGTVDEFTREPGWYPEKTEEKP